MKRKKTLFSIWLALFAIVMAVVASAAAVVYFRGSARGGILSQLLSVKAEAVFTTQAVNSRLSFTKTGQQQEVAATIENQCESVLHYYYTVETSPDNELAKAILVYYDGEFVGTLDELSANRTHIEQEISVVGQGETCDDRLTFELHLAADESFYDDKSAAVIVSAYTENADYVDAIYVADEIQFQRAVDDINSGMLLSYKEKITESDIEEGRLVNVPSIVLLSDLQVASILNHPCTIELNGHTLSGTLELFNKNMVLDVRNNGKATGMDASVRLTSYDETMVSTLLTERIKAHYGEGIHAGESANLLGTLAFYGSSVQVPSGSHYTYANDKITAGTVTETNVEYVDITLPSGTGFMVDFKVLGTKTSLDSSYFVQMPDAEEVVSTDLYLPVSAKEKNATITWTSLNPDIMDNTGHIVAPFAKHEPVELFAEIRTNDTVETRRYSFYVTARSNESNFYKLIAEVSPMTIYYVYDEVDKAYTTYYLPVASGAYDYRNAYDTPVENSSYENNPSYRWSGYQDIGLTKLEYYMTEDQKSAYDYIDLTNEGENYYLTLNQFTPNNYARLNVKGTYATGEEYESIVNVIIATGKNTELMEVAFHSVQDKLSKIDVLYNILETRKAEGMLNEKGDFLLPAQFEEYKIQYTKASDVISKIELTEDGMNYRISVNPELFSNVETKVPINCTITHGSAVENTRTLYFTVPAAIHTADMGNATLFNSAKYQVFEQLPGEEKTGVTGFIQKETQIVNNNPDYILLRDIVGDVKYHSDYLTLQLMYATEYTDQHAGCKRLVYEVPVKANVSALTDDCGYDLAALLQWATGSQKTTVSDVVVHTDFLGGAGSTVSDGAEYLNDDEVAVIKNYYKNATGISEEKWNVIWKKVSETPNGYLLYDTERFNRMFSTMIAQTNMGDKNAAESYFKYVETMQWADNEKDFGYAAGGRYAGSPPNRERIADFNWTIGSKGNGGVSFQDNKGTWWTRGSRSSYENNKYYTNSMYQEDNTEYLSDVEIEILKVLLLNNASLGNLTATLGKTIVDEFDASLVRPTFFTADGMAVLINQFYQDAGIRVGKDLAYTTYKQNNVPAIYGLDGIGAGLNYYATLNTLSIKGNNELLAFQGENLLEQFFNRMCNTNALITNLSMEYCAGNYVEFDVEATKNLAYLTSIDYSHNVGLKEVNVLVNTRRNQYKQVNISYIGANDGQSYFSGKQYDFTEYAVQHLASDSCTVIYGNGIQATPVASVSDELALLNEFHQIIAENMFAVNQVVDENGNVANVTWRVEEGNPIDDEIIRVAGTGLRINSFDDIVNRVSPYYYCTTGFEYDGNTYEAGHIYKYTCNEAGEILVTDLGYYEQIGSLEEVPVVDLDEFSNVDELIAASEPVPFEHAGGKERAEEEMESSQFASSEVGTTFEGEWTYGVEYTLQFTSHSVARIEADGQWYRQYFFWEEKADGTLGSVSINSIPYSLQGHYTDYTFFTVPQAQCMQYLQEEHSWSEIRRMVEGTEGVDYSEQGDGYIVTFADQVPVSGVDYMIYNPETKHFLQAMEVSNNGNIPLRFSENYETAAIICWNNGVINEPASGRYIGANWASFIVAQGNGATLVIDFDKGGSPAGNAMTGDTFKTPDSIEYSPYMTIYYKEGEGQTETIDGCMNVDFTITEYQDFYYETSSKGFEAQTIVLDDRGFYMPTEKSAYKSQYRCVHDSVVTAEKTDRYRVKSYELVGNYTTSEETVSLDWDKVARIEYTFYTAADDDTAVTHIAYMDGDNFSWAEDTYSLANTEYELMEAGEYTGENYDPANPDGVPVFEWNIEHSDEKYISRILEAGSGTVLDERKNIIARVADPETALIYRYVGSTGSEEVYKESFTPETINFVYGMGYQYQMTTNGLAWGPVEMEPDNEGGGRSMDSILDEANIHFGDNLYGMYYGRYYAYSGPEKVTQSGEHYITNWIYRIMPNKTNSAFTFVPVKPYTMYADIDIPLLEILRGNMGAAQKENAYYMNIGAGRDPNWNNWDTRTYYDGFYVFTYNTSAGSYYLKTFSDVYYNGNNAADFGNLVRFNNTRINAASNQVFFKGTGYYGGTGGNIPTVISAVVHQPNGDGTYTDYVRYFKVNVIG